MRNQIIRKHTVEEFIIVQSEPMITGKKDGYSKNTDKELVGEEVKNFTQIGDKRDMKVFMNNIAYLRQHQLLSINI